jgi:type I restriction enzyme, S subunit
MAWLEMPLGRAAEVTMGRQRSPKHATGDDLIPYLRAANVQDGWLDLGDVKQMNFTAAEQQKYALGAGDVLVTEGSGSISTVGASARWDGSLPGVYGFQNTLLRLRATPGVTEPGFVYLLARWLHWTGRWAEVATGTNIFHIGSRRAEGLSIPVPPLEVQRRIVDLVAHVDEAIAVAESNRHLIERARLAVLEETLGGSPATVRLDVVCEVRLGRQRSPKHYDGAHVVPYLRAANVQQGYIDTSDVMAMNFTPDEQKVYALQPGDVLLQEGGTPPGTGSPYRGDVEGVVCFQNSVVRLRPGDGIDPGYLWALASWLHHSGQFAAISRGTNSIQHLGASRASALQVPATTADEQARLAEAHAALEDARNAAAEAFLRLSRLRRALLDDLLSGEHVIPDSYDRFVDGVAA